MADLSKSLRAMKRILIILLALMPIMAGAQDFRINDNTITWQKVYQSDLTINDIYKTIIGSNNYYNVERLDDCIIAKSKPIPFRLEDYGMKWSNTCTLLTNGAIGPIVLRIDVKEGRYRVTASDMVVTDITPGGLSPVGETTRIEDVSLRRGEPTKLFYDQIVPVFGKCLERLATFTKEGDDW